MPAGFLWGAATASHQVEGENRYNDWWQAEQAGKLPYRSGNACEHWSRFNSDFDFARSLGHNAHRLSVEWSRIEPEPGVWNEEALDHYAEVVEALLVRGLEPIVTLHHFTNPQWLAVAGAWTVSETASRFARYAARVAQTLVGVKYWITINEPTVYAKKSYILGEWPPFGQSRWGTALRVVRNMSVGHQMAYSELHQVKRDIRVSFAHSAPWIEPCDHTSRRDRLAAWARDLIINRLVYRMIGTNLARSTPRNLDFVAINYYTRQIVRAGNLGKGLWFGEECREAHHPDRGPRSEVGGEVYPRGLLRVLEKYAPLGLPLLVTENGIATESDELRSWHLREHLAALGVAVERGIDVRGYFYWTLMDNYEWAHGPTARFGLAETDFATQERIPRAVSDLYAAVCHSNQVPRPSPAPAPVSTSSVVTGG